MHGRKKLARVEMRGMSEQLPGFSLLNNLALIHHGDFVSKLRNQAQIVRYIEVRK